MTFDIATADDSATDRRRRLCRRSTLTSQTIAAGLTSYTFDVTVNGDTAVEPDELFLVNVTNVVNATVGDGQGTGTISTTTSRRSRSPRSPTSPIAEGDGGVSYLVFTVSLSPSLRPARSPSTTPPPNGTAAAGCDYVALSGQVSFAAGETTKTISCRSSATPRPESDETFTLTLSNPGRRHDRRRHGDRHDHQRRRPPAAIISLVGGSFSQNWTNTGLITANDNWSGVPFIIGYLGDIDAGTADRRRSDAP